MGSPLGSTDANAMETNLLNSNAESRSLYSSDRANVAASSLLLERELALAGRCNRLATSTQKANKFGCPTISYEEALQRELEYRKRLKLVHPQLPLGLGLTHIPSNEVAKETRPLELKNKSAFEGNLPSPQATINHGNLPKQPANWQASRKKLQLQQPPSQLLQNCRPNSTLSFWCKICKVDCVTEFNFKCHIGGKKHKAKKLEILGGRSIGRNGNRGLCKNAGPSGHMVAGGRTSKPNENECNANQVGGSNDAGPSGHAVSSGGINRPNGTECNAPCVNDTNLAMHGDEKNTEQLPASQTQSGISTSEITGETSASCFNQDTRLIMMHDGEPSKSCE